MTIRDFSSSDECQSVARTIDTDAPLAMRQELIDLIFHITEQNSDKFDIVLGIPIADEHIHRVVCQSLGVNASGQPSGGYRYAAGRDIKKVEWPRVYDLICRLWPEFKRLRIKRVPIEGFDNAWEKPDEVKWALKGPVIDYRKGVNRILSAHGVVWEMSDNGKLERCIPKPALAIVEAAITELKKPEFKPAMHRLWPVL